MKTYTDIEQSKKLAEILPIESADMRYTPLGDMTHPWVWTDTFIEKDAVPCWSLAALLEIRKPNILLEHEEDVGWKASENVVIENPNSNLNDIKCVQGCSKDNPIDACVEIIINLHELHLL